MDELEEHFNQWLYTYGEMMVKELKYQLVFGKFPYAPGYNDVRAQQGTSNKLAGVGYGYESSLAASVQANYRFNDGEVDILMNEYWKWVNQGRQPGGKRPPLDPLVEWAKSPTRLGLNDEEARSAAFGIQTNIFRFGIKPTYFFDLAVDEVEKALEKGIENISDDINDFLTKVKVIDLPPIQI